MNTVALRKVSGNCKKQTFNCQLECVRWNVSEGNVPVVEDIKKKQSMSLSRRHSDLKLRLHRGQRGNGATSGKQTCLACLEKPQ